MLYICAHMRVPVLVRVCHGVHVRVCARVRKCVCMCVGVCVRAMGNCDGAHH